MTRVPKGCRYTAQATIVIMLSAELHTKLLQTIAAGAIHQSALIGSTDIYNPLKKEVDADAGEDAAVWLHISCQNSRHGMAGR